MHSFEEQRIIACSASTMYALVVDIPSYPQFLPWVADARILARDRDTITAELVAELAGMRYRFSTVDRLLPGQLVEIRLHEGPFRFLESIWSFDAVDDSRCRVRFSIQFAFRSMMLDVVAAPLFSTACRAMVAAFEQRALQLQASAR
ncbi:MAG: type II toxin-antitoxin system RatA family toxin [Zetaproteobacteria bacterium]|nr:MAG: type II toxin-antitoxin system RatA family toxin [Zetaproteobacteria bacterium]